VSRNEQLLAMSASSIPLSELDEAARNVPLRLLNQEFKLHANVVLSFPFRLPVTAIQSIEEVV
jgi:hypothetical protein